MSNPRKFAGVLAKPMQFELPSEPNNLVEPDGRARYLRDLQALDEQIASALADRWRALREHYGIADDCSWEGIARYLAHEFVPGFGNAVAIDVDDLPHETGALLQPPVKEKGQPGRKLVWDYSRYESLHSAINLLREQHGVTVEKACAELSKKREWHPAAGSTLRKCYYHSKKWFGNTDEKKSTVQE